MSVTAERVAALVAPLVEPMGLSVYDVEQPGGAVRILLDRPGGIDVESLTDATRAISSALDEADIIAGSYTLEVSSPGLERPLRTPEHFAAVVGDRVKVKLRPGTDGDRRADGVLEAADATTLTVATEDGERTVEIADVSTAHTVFEWAPAPKPGGKNQARSKNAARSKKPKGKAAPAGNPETVAAAPAPQNHTTESSEEHP